jgi:hypothetical protein
MTHGELAVMPTDIYASQEYMREAYRRAMHQLTWWGAHSGGNPHEADPEAADHPAA